MEAAERWGNSREVPRLTRLLSGRRHTRSINPPKYINGDLLVTQDQLLDEWSKFLGAKFVSPDADKNRSLECVTADDDELGDEELHKCLEALRCGKSPGCDRRRHTVGRWRPRRNTKVLFRICRLVWHNERIPPEPVRGMFVVLHKKRPTGRLQELPSNLPPVSLLQVDVCHRGTAPGDYTGGSPTRYTGRHEVAGTTSVPWFIQMILREGRQAVMTFIDYSAAFDTESQICSWMRPSQRQESVLRCVASSRLSLRQPPE